MLAHDWLNRLGGFIRMVEGNRTDVVVEDMGFNDSVKESSPDEAKFPVDGGGGASDVVPGSTGIVREGGVCMLKERYGD